MLARRGDAVEFIIGHVIAHHVGAVVGEPELVCDRMPVEADGVADAARHHLQAAAVGIHAHQVGIAVLVAMTDVARRADRHVQLAVRPEGDEFPTVVCLGREAVVDDDRGGRIVEPGVDAVQSHHP